MDWAQLAHNPFVSGGLTLMVLGGVLYSLKRLPGRLYALVERLFVLRMEILDEDEAYQWMQVWLAERLCKTLSISVVTRRRRTQEPDDDNEVSGRRAEKPIVYFVPAVGTYFFWYRRRFVTLNRDRQENASGPSLLAGPAAAQSMMRNKERFTLRIFSRNKDLARQLVEECRDRALPDDGKLEIRVANHYQWSLGTRVRPRPWGSVLLDGNQAEELLADMREFLAGYAWYQQTGVPFRRGYLLYGPPGNGKTSVVKALAGELGLSIYLLVLSDPEMTDNRINDLLSRVPDRTILLLEDIDCAFTRRRRASGRDAGLTFAGLLNSLDGVASPEGRIVVMTTNHLDRLDPALIRPGRADVKLAFGNATADQARRLFERFCPAHTDLAGQFSDRVGECGYSMATLQAYLMLHRRKPERALQRLEELDRLQAGTPTPAARPVGRNSRRPCRRG
jgi:chaperone BCS1